MSQPVLIEPFFDPDSCTYSYLVADPATGDCAIIDPVLDYDHAAGRVSRASADRLIDYIQAHSLKLTWILETHVHADHLSAARYLQTRLGGRIGIGDALPLVQQNFASVFGFDPVLYERQFDRLFADGETFALGELSVRVLHTPGHTPACVSYLIADAAFVGDTLFMPDSGTARCDFPGGDPRQLYRSIRRLLDLPDQTRLFLCHDYKAPGRDQYCCQTTVEAARAHNIHVGAGIAEDAFVALRTERDRTLGLPRLLLPSVQVNLRGGELPEAQASGIRYLKIPLDVL
ncbi:MBL fold metallo-hydrolase [Stutzerimonas nitrititolerans]|uniref:MBL fold metallo-hydrolase n=1 Tax=Stutzerimonas nitrititolerans TaxID=2482751 RepID=UPI0028A6DB83|nr:MBL fold metallo-hydrolase [Stutzerimonas nitrititolerans]